METQEILTTIIKTLSDLHGKFLDKSRFNQDRPEVSHAYDISAASLDEVIRKIMRARIETAAEEREASKQTLLRLKALDTVTKMKEKV